MALRIRTLVVGMLETGCYLLSDEASKEAIVIDPGGDAEAILAAIREGGLAVRLIVDTHGHFDHVLANGALREATGAPIAVGRLDAPLLVEPVALLGLAMGGPPSPPADRLLDGGDELALGPHRLRVLATPGHSPGGISLYAAEARAVFTGDALFRYGIGRTDLPGGDLETLERSIRTQLFTLPDDTVVYPGHGPASTIGQEKQRNPFLGEG